VTVQTIDPINTASPSSSFSPQGRLTLATGTPVMTTTQSAATTIYYTPYIGNQCPIYDGTQFTSLTFTELTNITTQSSTGNAGPAAVTTNSNYDLFVWSNGGTATLTRGPAWSSATARGTGAGTTELTRVSGVPVNAYDITNGPAANRGTYVGTVRSDGSSQINWNLGAVAAGGTAALLCVWNAYNRRRVKGLVGDSADSWNYTLATVRAANASDTLRASFVQGLQEDYFEARYNACVKNAGAATIVGVGIGYDLTTAVSGQKDAIEATSVTLPLSGSYGVQALGFHFMNACEWSNATGTSQWFGDNGNAPLMQTGLTFDGWF
jgi:hypothetical protein